MGRVRGGPTCYKFVRIRRMYLECKEGEEVRVLLLITLPLLSWRFKDFSKPLKKPVVGHGVFSPVRFRILEKGFSRVNPSGGRLIKPRNVLGSGTIFVLYTNTGERDR